VVDRKGRQSRNGRRESPAFQFYPQDFLSSPKVRHMSCAARGAYITLLCDCWLEGSLELDLAALACRVGMGIEEFTAIWRGALGRCFDEVDGRYVNPRMEREREIAEAFRAKMSEAGERSAQVRRDNAARARRRKKATPTVGEVQPTPEAKEPLLTAPGPLSGSDEPTRSQVQPTCTPVPSRPNPERANYVSSPPYPPAGGDAATPRGAGSEPLGVGCAHAEPALPEPAFGFEVPLALVGRVLAKDLEHVPPDVVEDLDSWAVHRRQIGRPLGESSVRKLLSVARRDPQAFRRRVEASIESGTVVLIEDRPNAATAPNGERLTAREAKQRRDHESGAKLERMLEEQLAKASGAAAAPRSAAAVEVWAPNGPDAARAKSGAFRAVTAEVRPC